MKLSRAGARACGIVLAVLAAWGTAAAAERTIALSEIRPGMKGHGLSVFSGTTPERFEVEAIAVLARFLPGMDLLLIRCSGHGMEKSGIVAGMSGSPIYFDGRLAGALSYGWSFAKEPIAGVTPIQAMLDDRRRATPEPPSDRPGLRKLATPLMVSGFSPRLMKRLERRLGPMGMLPFQGAAGSAASAATAAPAPVPGGAIGVDMIRGDYSASAVGTITHVDGERILAFGHPLFDLGTVELPATGAEVHLVFASLDMSFKFASPLGRLGSLVEDRQSCIVVRRGGSPRMVPVRILTRNARTGIDRRFALEVMDNPRVTPGLILDAVASSLDAAETASEDLTARVKVSAVLRDGRTIEIADRFHNGRMGALDLTALTPFLTLPSNPHDPAFLASVEVDASLSAGRETAEVLQAFPSARRVHPGETVAIAVDVKPYGARVTRLTIPVTLHAGTPAGRLDLDVQAGELVPEDAAQPEDLDGLLRRLALRRRSTELFVSYDEPAGTLRHRGFHIARAPGTLAAVLGGRPGYSRARFRADTDWILSGETRTTVDVVPIPVAR